MALVPRTAHTSRNDRGAIVVRVLNNCGSGRYPCGFFQHTGTEIVRDRQPGYTSEILIDMYMAEQPVFRLHVTAELGVNIADAGKNPYKKVCRNSFFSNRIFDVCRLPSPLPWHLRAYDGSSS